jgi:hypothetical protein
MDVTCVCAGFECREAALEVWCEARILPSLSLAHDSCQRCNMGFTYDGELKRRPEERYPPSPPPPPPPPPRFRAAIPPLCAHTALLVCSAYCCFGPTDRHLFSDSRRHSWFDLSRKAGDRSPIHSSQIYYLANLIPYGHSIMRW